jgi:glycosyltransferase involved in cell wall biosynthesis
MKVVHIITRLIIGGAQENTILTCEGLRALGHDVVLMAGPETGPEGSLWERAERGGYEVIKVHNLRRAISPIQDFRALREMRARLADMKPDVVHTHSSKAGIIGREAVPTDSKIVHTIHGMSFNRTQRPMIRRIYQALEKRAARRTDALIGVADAMTEQAVSAGVADRSKFTTIRSGMEVETFTPDPETRRRARAGWGVGEQDFVVGTIARLFANKGYEQILDLLPRVCNADDRLRFVWVGDGRHRTDYENELRRLGLLDRVILTGLVPPSDIPGLLAGFDVLIHASRWEGLPRAVVQALLMEVPVVCFDTDGAPEVVIDGETGRLIADGDTGSMAAALLELADDRDMRESFGRTGRARCIIEFDHNLMVSRIGELYRRIVSSSNDQAILSQGSWSSNEDCRTRSQ